MSILVNGQSQVPPGFRFHPTEEELLQYYLKKKVALEKIDLDVIQDVDLNKLEPWDIQEKCRIGTTPQNDWYLFSHKDKKYPTGTRTNRATCSGFWKATGRDKVIRGNSRRIGMRKTLVFYKGRAPHGQKSDWIMHEYRLHDDDDAHHSATSPIVCNGSGEGGQEEGWVVCRVFRKKTLLGHKISDSLITAAWSPSISTMNSCDEGTLEEMLHSMTSLSRRVDDPIQAEHARSFSKLPGLYNTLHVFGNEISNLPALVSDSGSDVGVQDWAALEQLSATLSHDNVDSRMGFGYGCPVGGNGDGLIQLQQQRSSSVRRYSGGGYNSEGDTWSFAPAGGDQLCDVAPVHPI